MTDLALPRSNSPGQSLRITEWPHYVSLLIQGPRGGVQGNGLGGGGGFRGVEAGG